MRLVSMVSLLSLLLVAGCRSTGVVDDSARPLECRADNRLVGTWVDNRMTQLGPARVTFTLDCDCRYTWRTLLAWTSISEKGFWTMGEGPSIVFQRPGGKEALPIVFKGETLLLEEAPGETHRFGRTRERNCR